jgi:hypothetical protein
LGTTKFKKSNNSHPPQKERKEKGLLVTISNSSLVKQKPYSQLGSSPILAYDNNSTT